VLTKDGYVRDANALATAALKMLGRTDIGLAFGWEPKGSTLFGYRIRVPYGNGDHFLVGDPSRNALYNPGRTYSDDQTLREIYVYAKN
jgi:hypothetical protein